MLEEPEPTRRVDHDRDTLLRTGMPRVKVNRSGGLRVLGGVMWEGVVVRIGDDSVD